MLCLIYIIGCLKRGDRYHTIAPLKSPDTVFSSRSGCTKKAERSEKDAFYLGGCMLPHMFSPHWEQL